MYSLHLLQSVTMGMNGGSCSKLDAQRPGSSTGSMNKVERFGAFHVVDYANEDQGSASIRF